MTAQRIGRYEVLRELGRGGMGVVHEVRDPDAPGRRLALKLLRADAADEAGLRRFLEREAQLLARVRHVNVVAVHTASWAREGPYLVMDLVEGRPLDQVTLAPDEAARVVRALCDALAALHAQGVLHRDLKPRNVVLRPDGTPVLLDFGLARGAEAERLTLTGELVGTPRYLAPESLSGAAADARTDVYGLGTILFELLGGEPPYAEVDRAPALLEALTRRDPVWPSSRRPVPRELEAIVRRAMARAPGDRFASAKALGEALDAHLRGEPPAEERRRRRRRRAAVAAAALVLALLAGALASRREPPEPAATALEEVAAWDARVLVPWGLDLGPGRRPTLDELRGLQRRLAAAAGGTPEDVRAGIDAALARLDACARRLDAGSAARAGPTTSLVAALECAELDGALRHLLAAAPRPPEWPLVRAELELRALRAGPRVAARIVPLLPGGALEGPAAAAFAERKGAALRDPGVASTWAEALADWILAGERAALPWLPRLLPATARAAPGDEAAFAVNLREALWDRRQELAIDRLARAVALDAWLRSFVRDLPAWDVEGPVRLALDLHRRSQPGPSPGAAYLALWAGHVGAPGLVRQIEGAGLDEVAPDPERSRAVRFARTAPAVPLDPEARAALCLACVEAPIDDLAPVYLAQAHERLLSAVGFIPADRSLHARWVAAARTSIAGQRALLRREPSTSARLGEGLRAELEARGRLEGWERAPEAAGDIEAFLSDAPPDRPDWPGAAAIARTRCMYRLTQASYTTPPEGRAQVGAAGVALAAATDLELLDFHDLWEHRAVLLRLLLVAGREAEALRQVDAFPDPRSWGHHLFPLYAAEVLRGRGELTRALQVVREGLRREDVRRKDTDELLAKVEAQLAAELAARGGQ